MTKQPAMAATLRRASALIVLLLVVQQKPTEATGQCRSGCDRAQDVLKFQPGTTYKYNYHGKIDVSLSTAEGQIATTEIKATVLLTQLPDCVQVLQLQNVQVLGSQGKKFGNIPDIEKPIKINNRNGLIEDQICAEKDDTQVSLNIKRAIASAFLVDTQGKHTTDVFGVCPTDVEAQKSGSTVTIIRRRDLNKCAYREHIKQDFLATTFNKNSEIKSSPVLQGDLWGTQTLDNGIVKTVETIESYLYVPFSVGKNGAKATVKTQLELQGQSKGNPKVAATELKSIIFDNPHPVAQPKNPQNFQNLLAAVKEVAKTIDHTVSEKTAKEFLNLIKVLRAANKDDILKAYSQVKSGAGFPDKDGARKVFLDALLRAGNGDAIQVAIELLKNREFNEQEQKKVYYGLSLARHASEESLQTAAQLLGQANLPREAFLGLGNLVGKYCRQHNCENNEAVNKLTQLLIKKLGDNKAANRKEESEMISVLKALGNFHHINEQIVTKIIQIAKDKTASNRLRVVALETFLSDPCQDKLRDAALSVLEDAQQDSEIRIKAYLAAAQCPNAKIGNAIKSLLDKEESFQVGGFIVTHIRNVRASANPDKDVQKQHLSFILPQKFPVDFRKWSYNNELSYAFDTLGVASSAETNVIYSQDSWLPRSLGLNLTAEVFGHNVNFLEIETRQENLDRLIGHYFGPKGLMRSDSLQGWWQENNKPLKESLDKIKDKVTRTLRLRRDVSKAEIEKISKEVVIKENTLDKDLDLDMSVKAFGSEVLFLNANENVQKWTPDSIINRIIDSFNKDLDKLQNFEETLRANLVFLDAEFNYPTLTGFPLRMAVEGAANLQLKTKGAIDLRAILGEPKDTLFKLSLIPSATIEISGRLTVDTQLFENGLKIISTLHSSLGGDANLQVVNNGHSLEVKYSLPVKKQVLVGANHEIVSHIRELGNRETNTPLKFAQNKDFSICIDHLKDYIGLEFCGEYSGPNLSGKQVPVLPFPLNGDSSGKIEVLREDVKEFVLKQNLFTNQPNKLGAELSLSTIGNNGQRKAGVSLTIESAPERFIKAEFTSPKYNGLAEARVTSNDKEKTILGRVNYFGNEFYGKVGVSVAGTASKAVYKPLLEYKTPKGGINALNVVEGQIIVENSATGTKYVFDNVRFNVPNTDKQYTVKGDLGKENDAMFTNLELSDGKQQASLAGRVQVLDKQLKINVELKNTFNPAANVKVQGEFKSLPKLESHLTVIHGADLSSKTNVLTLTNSLVSIVRENNNHLLETKNRLTYPALNLDVKLELESKPKKFESEVKFKYGEVDVGSEIEFEVDQKEKGDYKLELELWGLDNKIALKSSRLILGFECKIDNTLNVNGKILGLNGKVKHVVKPQNMDVSADLNLILPTHNNPFKILTALKYDPNNLDASQKITSGGQDIVNLFLKADKAGNANGSIKITIKDVLVVNGQIKAAKGQGSGDVLVDLQTLKKQVKGETTFTVQPPKTYTVSATLYPLYNTDKSKKIVLSTQNKVEQDGVESKNSIDLVGNKFTFNVKGQKNGDLENGKVNGEMEIILPTDQYFLYKLNRQMKTVNGVMDGEAQASLEHRKNKNTPGHKLSIKGTVKKTNLKEKILDLEYELAVDDSNGKTLNNHLLVKRQKNGEEAKMEVISKLSGSLLKNPIEGSLTGTCKRGVGDFALQTSYGPGASYSVKGNYNAMGESAPYSASVTADVKSHSEVLKNLKWSASASFKKPKTAADYVEFQTSSALFAQGSKPEPLVELDSKLSLKIAPKDGNLEASLKVAKKDPIKVVVGYSQQGTPSAKQLNVNGAVQYEASKTVKVDVSFSKLAEGEYKLVGQLDTPVENHKNNKIVVSTKRDGSKVHSNVEFVTDGKKWTADTLVYDGPEAGIETKIKAPDGKLTELVLRSSQKGAEQLSLTYKLSCEAKNFLLEGNLIANVPNSDNFHIKGAVNSPNLKLDKIEFDAQTKPGSNGRAAEINIKSAGKNLLSGSTNYQVKKEGDATTIVEGSGTFKVRDEAKSGNFKLISKKLTIEKNQEAGIDVSFDGKIGNKAIDIEYKVTNKHFRWSNSYCEEKKECAFLEVDSKIAGGVQQFSQELEISVDLRKLGLTHEFGLKSVTKRDGYIVDHTVDVHFQNKDQSKYQYSLYVHPKEAGWSLTTPKRQVALEVRADYPKTILKEGGKLSLDVNFYLDKKNQPSKKSSINLWTEIRGNLVNGELKLVHPELQRPLSMSLKSQLSGQKGSHKLQSTLEMDIFAQPGQKLLITYETSSETDQNNKISIKESIDVKSTGLGINILILEAFTASKDPWTAQVTRKLNYQVGRTNLQNEMSWAVSKTSANMLIRFLNVDIVRAQSKLNLSKNKQIVDSEITSYDNNPLIWHLEVSNWNTIKSEFSHKKSPGKKLLLTSALIPGQIADSRADLSGPQGTTNLFHANVKLDEANFLKPDYSLNSEAIKGLLGDVREEATVYLSGALNVEKEWLETSKRAASELSQVAQRAMPDFTKVKEYYASELKKLKEEIMSDKTIKELTDAIRSLFHAVSDLTAQIFKKVNDFVEEIARAVKVSFEKLLDTIQKEMIPHLQDIGKKVLDIAAGVVNMFVDVILGVMLKINEILEKYQKEIKNIVTAMSSLTQNINNLFIKAYNNARLIIVEQYDRILNQVKALPMFEELKNQYEVLIKNGIPNVDQIIAGIKEVLNSIYEIIPKEYVELKTFLNTVEQYLEKKLKNQKVDDFQELDKIVKAALAVLRKILNAVSTEANQISFLNSDLSMNLGFFSKLPRLVAAKFSPLSHILKDESTGYIDFLLSLITKPRNLFAPFPMVALLGQGQHIFTFDGKHYTFPGNCNYLLARDALNGYFTLAATYSNGLLASVTLSSGKELITLKKGGQILVNNVPSELPAHRDDIFAWRDYYTVTLKTKTGAQVVCTPDLNLCIVKLSGFYHGQIRGLLGNGNNDPYDDFTLANNKIVTSETEFANTYKTQASCPQVKAEQHQHGAENPTCTKLFAWDSPLALCSKFVKPDNFKIACNHGLAANVKDTEETIAKLYVTACQEHGIPVRVPDHLAKCRNGDKGHDVGLKFSVKLPAKAADIVLVVDTVKQNEKVYKDLIQPLITDVLKQLHSKQITDVEFHLITYGGENRWPSHVTVNGKLQFKGKPPNVKFTEAPKELPIPQELEKFAPTILILKDVARSLQLALGLNLEAKTYTEAFSYPFRAHAVKSIVVATSEPCETGKLLLLQKLRTLLFRNNQIKLNLITPFEAVVVKDTKKTKDVVGFNSEAVFTLSQGKKKPEGSAELHKDLQYDDYCIDFVLKSGGNVFMANNFLSAKGEAKTFVSVAAHNIVDRLTDEEQGLDCECKMTSPWGAQNVCHQVYAKEKSKKTVARG